MDVHCSTCSEPWDTYHLLHEVIYDIGLSDEEAAAWRSFPPHNRLLPHYREKFEAGGWRFGASLLNVMRCPCCPKDAKPNPDKTALKAGLVEILGDDEDAIAATMDELGL